ncbi:lactonase family protein [Aestuariimicrobium soli]|uniref:lactonase family protein n=1 Tax=Aestuariimicrobium soli TaxID=2035834 RepID=UPI003EC14A5E
MRDLVLVANAGDGTVSSFRFTGGTLEPLTASPVGQGCGTFVVDEARDLVYAASKSPSIDTFRLDRGTGTLTRQTVGDEAVSTPVEASMAYVDLAHDGSVLVAASYGGDVAQTWTVDESGVLTGPVAQVEWHRAHCVVVRGDRLYVVSLGADLVAQYELSPAGELTPLDPPTAAAPAGSGPRHLVFAADGRHAFVVTEFSGEVLTFDVDESTGALTPSSARAFFPPDAGLSHSRLGAPPLEEHLIWGADVHQAGGHVLATERTTSTLASLPLADDGSLGEPVARLSTPTQPRGFWVLDDARHAVVAGERATEVALVEIADDGSLVELGRFETGAGANWVRAV